MKKISLPTTSMYCDVCTLKEQCDKPKVVACLDFKTNVPFKTPKT